MKRARDYETITSERDAAFALYNALERERMEHPIYVANLAEKTRQWKLDCERRDRQQLVSSTPVLLANAWLNSDFDEYGRLVKITIDCNLEEIGAAGAPARVWSFYAEFTNKLFSCTVDTSSEYYPSDNRFKEFNPVDFVPRDSIIMWDDALVANDEDKPKALAAFCYACCEHEGDFSIYPSTAFPPPKGKKESISA